MAAILEYFTIVWNSLEALAAPDLRVYRPQESLVAGATLGELHRSPFKEQQL
jgi:hypothetical protein